MVNVHRPRMRKSVLCGRARDTLDLTHVDSSFGVSSLTHLLHRFQGQTCHEKNDHKKKNGMEVTKTPCAERVAWVDSNSLCLAKGGGREHFARSEKKTKNNGTKAQTHTQTHTNKERRRHYESP